ncbi:hypothetical protein PUN28_004342 [Cardiocondyla obscurior]
MVRNLNHQDTTISLSDSEFCQTNEARNSVIVINDSDSDSEVEITDFDNGKPIQIDDTGENNTSVKIIECISAPSSSAKKKPEIIIEQINSRSSKTQLYDSVSLSSLSSTESLLNKEDDASTKAEDDVVELWSCLQKSNARRKRKRKKNKTNAMYMIDKKPNLNYLKYLEINKQSKKRKRKHDLSSDEEISKCADSSRERQNDKSLESSSTNSPCLKKKMINSNEQNSQIYSAHKLRTIVVDGCNVALSYTNGKKFSEKGIQMVVDYFKLKGHTVKVFLPQHIRKKEYTYVEQLYKTGIVVFTPSRIVEGKLIASYDDRFILKYATSCGGIVVSKDQYRDLYKEKPEWRDTIKNRLLIPTFVEDYIMFPEDPLGRFGPNLEQFLRHY